MLTTDEIRLESLTLALELAGRDAGAEAVAAAAGRIEALVARATEGLAPKRRGPHWTPERRAAQAERMRGRHAAAKPAPKR